MIRCRDRRDLTLAPVVRLILLTLVLLAAAACPRRTGIPVDMIRPAATGDCRATRDRVVAEDAVAATWIPWSSPCLPDANVAYVNRRDWDVWVMDSAGARKSCLTCFGDNVVGIDFPLDRLGRIHWKGDPEAHPTLPVILFKAENENSAHRALRNSPSIGWDNDLWALDPCRRRYKRLTKLSAGEGLQHSAISNDGRWYVYPRRDPGDDDTRSAFQLAVMVFARLVVDPAGDLHLRQEFVQTPIGPAYYEPNDIRHLGGGRYALTYVAGRGKMLDPYRLEWSDGPERAISNTALRRSPRVHEEFLMASPDGRRLAWMAGPLRGFGYRADLFVSRADLSGARRLTWYNDCAARPEQCLPHGGQLSRLAWSGDGRSLYYGVWEHGAILPFARARLHRLDLAGPCGSEAPLDSRFPKSRGGR